METKQNSKSDHEQSDSTKKALSPESKRKLKSAGVSLGLSVVCALSICFIFLPEDKQAIAAGSGINTSIPDGKSAHIDDDKAKEYALSDAERIKRERQRDMQSLATIETDTTVTVAVNDKSVAAGSLADGSATESETGTETAASSITQSQEALRRANTAVGSFYDENYATTSCGSTRKRTSSSSRSSSSSGKGDAMDMLERSYALAAQYLGTTAPTVSPTKKQAAEAKRSEKSVVSTLGGDGGNAIGTVSGGFNTAVGTSVCSDRNTICASVCGDQRVTIGERVKLMLAEPIIVCGRPIPKNTELYGTTSFSEQRLQVVVESIEYAGNIYAVSLAAYDTDGQVGLNIPVRSELTAAREALASASQTTGSMSVTFGQDAAGQLATDVGRSAVSSATKYIAERLKELRITLKAGHNLFLISKTQNNE